MKIKLKHYEREYLQTVMNPSDFAEWLSLEEKGKRLGDIVNNPKARSQYSDATRGMHKIAVKKIKLLQKYNLQ